MKNKKLALFLIPLLLVSACGKKEEAKPVTPPVTDAQNPGHPPATEEGIPAEEPGYTYADLVAEALAPSPIRPASETAAAAPGVPGCSKCDWNKAAQDAGSMPIYWLGCRSTSGSSAHCHLPTRNFAPKRFAALTKNGNNFDLHITPDRPDQGTLDCLNLVQQTNRQLLRGTCVLDETNIVNEKEHNFIAKIEPMGSGKVRIRFIFQHEDFNAGDRPIHNGEGHIHPNL